MKQEEELPTWEAFVARINAVTDPDPLFRGHANASWSLETTLERRGRPGMSVDQYYRLIASRVKPQIESITGRKFDVPAYSDVKKMLKEYDDFSMSPMPAYSYLLYTRHHGFPSPLLDWTRSPYIAAFFAFAAANGSSHRSIYMWPKSRYKTVGSSELELRRLGQFETTHPRHVLQQADYSMCVSFETSKWKFMPHEDAFAKTETGAPQLTKFNIPSSERDKVLRFLDSVNLNAYSLFLSEDALMEMLAVRVIDLGL